MWIGLVRIGLRYSTMHNIGTALGAVVRASDRVSQLLCIFGCSYVQYRTMLTLYGTGIYCTSTLVRTEDQRELRHANLVVGFEFPKMSS
jgi:hypothetical protein